MRMRVFRIRLLPMGCHVPSLGLSRPCKRVFLGFWAGHDGCEGSSLFVHIFFALPFVACCVERVFSQDVMRENVCLRRT